LVPGRGVLWNTAVEGWESPQVKKKKKRASKRRTFVKKSPEKGTKETKKKKTSMEKSPGERRGGRNPYCAPGKRRGEKRVREKSVRGEDRRRTLREGSSS